ncbi:putative thioesterase [Peptoniphilus olsenii]|uniref:Thioesterase n=1 Tax=Peptoniphilus olsenii TaxID=411570 RepID=A0ABV2JB03_9FIRM
MKIGIKKTKTLKVNKDNTAEKLKSGTLAVFATPAMIALIEETAWTSVAPYLENGQATVGTNLNIAHISATPLDMEIKCETELIEIDKRKLVFDAKVYDEKGLIGEGTHERFIIDSDKFLQKAESKKNK